MRRMRAQVADNNIYRWAGMLLSEVGKLAAERARTTPGPDGRPGGDHPAGGRSPRGSS